MVQETRESVYVDKADYEELLRVKDECINLRRQVKVQAELCAHECTAGHRAIDNVETPEERESRLLEARRIDYEAKQARIVQEEARLTSLVKNGRINREQKEQILAKERERMGL